MSDIVNTIRGGFCEPNVGCMSIKKCICDVLDEAADEIEWLRYELAEYDRVKDALQAAHIELATALDQIEERRRVRSAGRR